MLTNEQKLRKAWAQGMVACEEGRSVFDNPYIEPTDQWLKWEEGWYEYANRNFDK